MSKHKKAEVEDERTEVELNSELLDQFTDSLETAINKVCEDNSNTDPRLELLVTLGCLAAQVALDSNHPKDEFLALMSDLFDDIEEASNSDDENDEYELLLASKKKGNQFDLN